MMDYLTNDWIKRTWEDIDGIDGSGAHQLLQYLLSRSSQTQKTFEPIMMLRGRKPGRPRKDAQTPAIITAAADAPQGHIAWSPHDLGGPHVSHSALEQAVLRMNEEHRPANTSAAYDPKVAEFKAYCTSVYADEEFAHNLDHTKVWKFMFYQCMRPKKKCGGPKNRANAFFDRLDYDKVMAAYKDWFGNQSQPPPEPADPVGRSVMVQYKAAVQCIFQDQKAKKVCAASWEDIWPLCLKNLENLVKGRRAANNKKNHVEKLDHEFAPYTIVEEYPKIEAAMWERGNGTSRRSTYAWLRHRFCLLFSTSGILRCESLFKAELSDFLGLHMKKETDPHKLFLMIMQIPSGN
jgi:hypothetical protein